MNRRRWAAVVALLLAAAAVGLAVVVTIQRFPHALFVLLCAAVAIAAATHGALHRGPHRLAGLLVAVGAVVGAIVLVVVEHEIVADIAILALAIGSLAAARQAFRIHVALPAATTPRRPVLVFNPLSGGGTAERFQLADEARSRGIEPIELRRGDELETLARRAVADGADALAMGGGDGSQAIVAAIAAEAGLPYACVPAGTRNHFALDLGVNREDVVGGLDALVDGGERRVDLGEVNGRVFVNNVSLGIYGVAVQRAGYRDAKLRTLLDTVPEVLGEDAEPLDLRWRGAGGREHRSAAAILVSNNRYRLGDAVAPGTRPRIDDGLLSVTVVGLPSDREARSRALGPPWRQWEARRFEVDAADPVAAGIDGEAVMLDPPLVFRIRPGVLRVRISRRHPGASPSAGAPEGLIDAIESLVRIALGAGDRGQASVR